MLDRFGEGAGGRRGVFGCRGGEDVGREEGEAEGEVGGGEDGERLDEDVGRCLLVGEMRVELVSEETLPSVHAVFQTSL